MLGRKNNLEAIAFLDVIAAEVREGLINQTCTKGQNTKKIHRLQNAKIRCRLQAGSQVFVLTPATNSSLPDTLFTSIWPDIVLTKSVNSILYLVRDSFVSDCIFISYFTCESFD